MTNWQTKTIGELVDYEQPSKYLVKDTNYIEDGMPVLTANKAFILGYTHETEGTYVASKDSPVIIFDDFTTDNKFVDFDFKVKSSAIKILTAKPSKVLPRFVHGAMQLIKTEITEHKRRFISEYQFHPIDTPELAEQERIVGVLEVWDEYIEKMEQKIALKEQLKKGLMQQLLTGMRRLPGFNNKWQVSSIGEVSEFINGYTFLSSSYVNDGKFKIITIANVQDGRMDSESAKTIMGLPKNINDQQMLKVGDIIISMTGNVGRTCRVDIENGLLNQRVGKIVANKTVRSDYLYYLLQSRHFLAKMIERAQGGAQDNLSAKDIKKYRIVLPTYDEQTAIANILCSADLTISGLKSKKDAIVKQKQYLLKNLITGTIRTPETLTPKGTNA